MKYQCLHCSSVYGLLGNLTKHQKIKHGLSKNNICECGKVFEKAQSLNAHYRHCLIHREGKPTIPPGNKGKASPARGLSYEQWLGEDGAKVAKDRLSKANTGRKPSVISRQLMSEKRIAFLEKSPHIKWFQVGSIKVQGAWEKHIAEKLLEAGLEFKRIRLPYDGCRTYTPDFYVPALDIYIEVKGWMSDPDKKKYQKVMVEHPEKNIKLLLGKEKVFSFNVANIKTLPNLKDGISFNASMMELVYIAV